MPGFVPRSGTAPGEEGQNLPASAGGASQYSDENDYTGFNATTGVPARDPANDSRGQILAHRTWDGRSAQWSAPVVDIAGLTQSMGGGKTEIGGGRPGVANVVRTTDGKWLLTFEYWGGGATPGT
jgi:hypothetical protein